MSSSTRRRGYNEYVADARQQEQEQGQGQGQGQGLAPLQRLLLTLLILEKDQRKVVTR